MMTEVILKYTQISAVAGKNKKKNNNSNYTLSRTINSFKDLLFFFLIWKLKLHRKGKREKFSICWFTPQMASRSGAELI